MIGLLFIISLVVLSQAATLIRLADAGPLAICFWRLLFAVLLMLPFLVRKRRYLEFSKLSKSDAWHLLLSGFFLFTHFYFFFRSAQETTIADCTILFSLNPVTTSIGAWFLFRERVTLNLMIACGLGFAGVAATLAGSFGPIDGGSLVHTTLRGDVWGVLAAICFSGYILTGKRVRLKISNIPYAIAIYFQTALYAAIFMLFMNVSFTAYSQPTWWAFLLLAILPTLMGHAIFTYCLNYLNVNFMSCMTLTEPVFAAIAGWIFFHEKISNLAVIGFFLTCASIFALYWPSLTKRMRTAA